MLDYSLKIVISFFKSFKKSIFDYLTTLYYFNRGANVNYSFFIGQIFLKLFNKLNTKFKCK